MAILDIFKKKQAKKPKPKMKEAKPLPSELKAKPVEMKRERKKTDSSFISLKSPHVTEKATDLVGFSQYVFKVSDRANKTEIRKAIEGIYGVDVVSVKIINVPEKKRRLGKVKGFRKGYKKACVGIKQGQKIEVLPR